jgi:carbamoyl-phosphate synthase large subunit
LLKIREAFLSGKTVEEIFDITRIDPWFLYQIKMISDEDFSSPIKQLKENGFSDMQIAKNTGTSIDQIRSKRIKNKIIPSYKLVDTCSAEFNAKTPYCYSTYDSENEVKPLNGKKIIILGGGPNRIGQGIEFDYCCVQAVFGLKELGYKTIMVNCNPETVSTDFDLADRLYFEPITFEDVLNIIDFEKPDGVLVQFGGQTPLKISKMLAQAGAPIIGTSPLNIDVAEDREKFGKILNKLDILCPTYGTGRSLEEVIEIADSIGYPVLARPSYVLGGRAMEIVYSQEQLIDYIARSADVTQGHPILIDQFLEDAFEFDVDALCDSEEVYIGAIMQHIEEAGIHSGDSACVLPPYQIKSKTIDEIEKITSLLAIELNVMGLINIQFAYKENHLYVLEVNPRASRTIPFVSKSTNVPLAKIAAQLSTGLKLKDYDLPKWNSKKHISIKEAVLPFNKFPSESIFLSPEMKSTGEVMGISENFGLSFYKATLSAGTLLPNIGLIFVSVNDQDKFNIISTIRGFSELGFELIATTGTATELMKNGMNSKTVYKVGEGRPNIVDYIKNNEISLVINTPLGAQSRYDEEAIGKACIQKGVMAITTISAADAVLHGIRTRHKIQVKSLQEYHN